MTSPKLVDVVLIGGGIMSATLGVMIKKLQPDWSIVVLERLSDVALESSNPWNNAGTGHSALCELNYMPEAPDGSVDAAKAVSINEQYQTSRQFWSSMVEAGELDEPETFLNSTPHMTFVEGEDNVAYLRKRYEALKVEPLFAGIEYSEDPHVIAQWVPLMIKQRPAGKPMAATRVEAGTDVDFGSLTHQLFRYLTDRGAELRLEHEVRSLKQLKDSTWQIGVRHRVGNTPTVMKARFVFVGAGGGALHLLQKAGIPEASGYGGFPISGEFFRTDNPDIVARHHAKVYGKASVGAPPMSVPHLDTRVVDGDQFLLFGPYAGFSPKFLKTGSILDLPLSIRPSNIIPMLAVAKDNFDLLKYLVSEVTASKSKKFKALREFVPTAEPEDWHLITAGQRVQVMKKDAKKGGVLQFGTEVVTSADGTISGLLGASPGASTAVPIMLGMLRNCFPDQIGGWEPKLQSIIPTYGTQLTSSPATAKKVMASTAKALGLPA